MEDTQGAHIHVSTEDSRLRRQTIASALKLPAFLAVSVLLLAFGLIPY